jgi:prepilin peptidase CpaA
MLKGLLITTLFPGLMVVAAFADLLSMTIPNWLTIALAAGFFIVAALIGLEWADISVHIAVAIGAFALSLTLFWLGWIAGGDVKLFVATSLWVGPQWIVAYSLYASVFGMILALILLFLRALRLPSMLMSQGWLVRLHNPEEGIPYGIALAGAGLLIYPSAPFMSVLCN